VVGVITTLDRPLDPSTGDQHSPRHSHLPIRVSELSVVATLALTCVTLATAVSLCRAFPGWAFLRSLVVIAVVMHGYSLWCRWRRWPMIPVTLAGLGLLAVLLGLAFYRHSLAVIVPTRTTWNLAWRDLSDSMHQFPTAIPPVPAVGGFVLAAAIGIGVCALASDVLAFRAYGRAEAIVPTLLMFVIGSSLGYDRNRIAVTLLWLLTVIVALGFLRALHAESSRPWLSTDRRRRTATVVAGAVLPFALVAVPIGIYAGSHLPGSTSKAILEAHSTRGNTSIVSPLVSVQARLTSKSDVEMFTVKTDHPALLRLTSFADFDGASWTNTGTYGDAGQLDQGPLNGTDSVATITVNHLGDRLVPVPFEPLQILSESRDFTYDQASSSLLYSQANLVQGLQLQVESVLPRFTADELRSAPPSAGPDPRYRKLPANFPKSFVAQARQITVDATTPFDQALALQNWFRDNFRYDVNVPAGDSHSAMQAFLNSRAGFCQHFAATFAAFARAIGLPTRVATGFTQGDIDANGLYHVKGKHAHAWPEVWLEGFGWVYFEPTPGRGAPDATPYTGVAPAQAGGVFSGSSQTDRTNIPSSVPVTVSPRDPRIRSNQETPDTRLQTPSSTPTGGTSAATRPRHRTAVVWWLLAGLAAIVSWMVLMPPTMRMIRRRRHRDTPAEYVTSLWHCASVGLRAVGFEYRPEETPLQQAARSASSTGWGQHALTDLAEATTSVIYSPTPPTAAQLEHVDSVYHAVATSLRQRASWTVRLRARLDPRLAIALA
jgi:transglutaminase-like putative cysteine protease